MNANHPKDIVELDEFLALRKEVLAETPVKEPEEVTEKAAGSTAVTYQDLLHENYDMICILF